MTITSMNSTACICPKTSPNILKETSFSRNHVIPISFSIFQSTSWDPSLHGGTVDKKNVSQLRRLLEALIATIRLPHLVTIIYATVSEPLCPHSAHLSPISQRDRAYDKALCLTHCMKYQHLSRKKEKKKMH